MRKFNVLFCIISIITSIGFNPNFVYAQEYENDDYGVKDLSIIEISDNSFTVTEGDGKQNIEIIENDDILQIKIQDLNSNKTDFITFNKNENIINSTITNKTINVNESPEFSPNSLFYSSRSVQSFETKFISYASIKSMIGGITDAGHVIAAILFFVPGAKGIGGAIGAVSTIVKYLNNGVSNSSQHGIKLGINVTKYYRTRNRTRKVYRTIRDIVSFSYY